MHRKSGPETASHEEAGRALTSDFEWCIPICQQGQSWIRLFDDALCGLDRSLDGSVASGVVRATHDVPEVIRFGELGESMRGELWSSISTQNLRDSEACEQAPEAVDSTGATCR